METVVEEPAEPAGEPLLADIPDIRELVAAMTEIPLIMHDILAHFQRLKAKNKALFVPHGEG
ncbi:MAG: hypothetical protein GY765_08950 [bacterium]|nr:hypothetical protein [bacterium]